MIIAKHEIKFPESFDEMVSSMLLCEQTRGQTVYQHGQSVLKHFNEIRDSIEINHELSEDNWKIPDWLKIYGSEIMSNVHNHELVSEYLIFHDLGKPFCRIQENGVTRFPNHAEISKSIWMRLGGSEIVGNLIGWDMDIHTSTSEDISRKLLGEWSMKDACTLLLASLAELHSNSKMFGGISSISFKSKWKNIDRRGKQICKTLFGEKL